MSNVTFPGGTSPVASDALVNVDGVTIFGNGADVPLTTDGGSGVPAALTRNAVLPGSHPDVVPGAVLRATGTDDTVTLAFANSPATANGIGIFIGPGPGGIGVTYAFGGAVTLNTGGATWEAVNDQGTLLTPGSPYYLSAINDGNITAATGESDDPLVQVGVAINENTLLINTMVVFPALNPAATPAGAPVAGMALRVSAANTLNKALADGSVTAQVSGLMFGGNADGSIAYKTNGPLTLTTGQWDAVVTGESGGLTPGASYYSSAATAGKLTTTPPVATGSFVVLIGTALSSTTLIINISAPVGPHS